MIKKTKKAPTIRFRDFTDDWEQRKLGELVQITMGQSPNGTTYSEKPSKYILIQGNADLKNGWVVPRIWTTQKTKFANAGDLIMSVRAPAGAMGKTAYDVVIGRGVAAIKGNEFIFQALSKMNANGYWKKIAAGSTFESINSDAVRNAEIVIPHNKEQEKIGQCFLNLDNLITLHQRKLDQLKTLKKYFLQNMFPAKGEKVPRIRFKGFTGDWEQRKLGELMEVGSVKRVHQSDWRDSGVRFLRARDVVAEYKNEQPDDYLYIDERMYNAYSALSGKVQKGDLLVTGVGTIGIPMLIKSDKPVYFKDGNIIWFKNKNAINGDFFYYAFISSQIQNFIKEAAGTGTVGTYTIASGKKTPIALPVNRKEQEQIGAYIGGLDNLITLHQRKLDQLQTMKKFMLQNMFI